MSQARRRSTGQALAEFAIVFPIFMLSVLILIDFARAIFVYSVISDAAREGARYAIVHGVIAATDNPPATGPGTGDPDGSINVVPQAKSFAFGLDQSALRVAVCWGYRCTVPPDCGAGTNTASSSVADVPVTVRTCYDFTAITATFLRQGTISLGAQSTLTVTH